jgi:predicted esterase
MALSVFLAARAPAQDANDWAERLTALRSHQKAAFQVGHRLVDVPRDVALNAVQTAWPDITFDGTKTGLFKAFHFGQHPDVLEVLHLGATDESVHVREYAFNYLRTFAWRDFAAEPEAYASWRETCIGKDVEDVLHASVTAWVESFLDASDEERDLLVEELDTLGLLGRPNTRTFRPSVLRYARQAGLPEPLLNPDASVARDAQRRIVGVELSTQDLRAGGDANKRYFLIGGKNGTPGAGYKLLVVIPGGSGDESFHPFVKRLAENWLPPGFLVAQLVSKSWTPDQFDRVVWPTAQSPAEEAEFTTEEFVESVVADVHSRKRIYENYVYVLGWSSGGPPAYAATLTRESSIRGAFILASVFKPPYLPNLAGAEGKSFFILHSPDDFIPIRMAEQARHDLQAHGAATLLETYPDGHGWPRKLDVVARGLAFLEAIDFAENE